MSRLRQLLSPYSLVTPPHVKILEPTKTAAALDLPRGGFSSCGLHQGPLLVSSSKEAECYSKDVVPPMTRVSNSSEDEQEEISGDTGPLEQEEHDSGAPHSL